VIRTMVHAVSDDFEGLKLACAQGQLPGIDPPISPITSPRDIIPLAIVKGMWVWRATGCVAASSKAESTEAISSRCPRGSGRFGTEIEI